MIKKIRLFLYHIFNRKNPITVDLKATSIPEGFGYPEDQFKQLVDDLRQFIRDDDRLLSLVEFLKNEAFNKYKLDLNNPNNAALLGYAFCTAILIQRGIHSQMVVNKVLSHFYPNKSTDTRIVN